MTTFNPLGQLEFPVFENDEGIEYMLLYEKPEDTMDKVIIDRYGEVFSASVVMDWKREVTYARLYHKRSNKQIGTSTVLNFLTGGSVK